MSQMEADTIRRITTTEQRLDDLVHPEMTVDTISPFLALPGLRGFWGMAAFGSAGQAFDQSGNARTLTRNGSPAYTYENLVSYIDLNGTTDYLSRADEAGIDIIGTETIVVAATRGLTLGGWVYYDVVSGTRPFMAKFGAVVGDRAYMIDVSAGASRMILGTGAAITIYAGSAVAAAEWTFFVGRWFPSTTADIFVNGTKTPNASVIAALGNSTSQLRIGADSDNPNFMDGRVSRAFLCVEALSDAIISSLFESTKAAYRID